MGHSGRCRSIRGHGPRARKVQAHDMERIRHPRWYPFDHGISRHNWVRETTIIIDISALHPDHYPRIKKMLKNLKLKRAKVYVVDLIDGLSIALNILFGGNPAETISSRAFRTTESCFWRIVRRILDTLLTPRADNHCCKSYNRCLERSKALLGNRFR